MAAMGIAGFGKQQKQRKLDPHRFDKNKRVEPAEVRSATRFCMYHRENSDFLLGYCLQVIQRRPDTRSQCTESRSFDEHVPG